MLAIRPGLWVVSGDFNMIYRNKDKSNDNLHPGLIGRFRHFLNACELKELFDATGGPTSMLLPLW